MEVKAIGEPCGFNGSYTFYKGLQILSSANKNNLNCNTNTLAINFQTASTTIPFNKNKPMTRKCVLDKRNEKLSNSSLAVFKQLVLTLGDFIPVKPWSDSHIACLAEIRMIWRDKNEHSLLTGLRLYFLPENTPSGRNCHGEDEVLAISDKVVIRAEDLLNWFDEKFEWNWGLVNTPYNDIDEKKIPENRIENCQIKEENSLNMTISSSLKKSQINFSDVQIDKRGGEKFASNITVMSYPRYCRFRATLKRLEGVTDEWVKNSVVAALCGFSAISSSYRVMFCRDTFDYPELETHELLCNHLAPKLKGRRRKLFSRNDSPFSGTKKSYDSASDSNESDISLFSVGNEKVFLQSQQPRSHLRCNYRAARNKGKLDSNINPKLADCTKIDKKLNTGYEQTYNEKNKFLRTNDRTTRYKSLQLSGKKIAENISNSSHAEEKFFLRKLHEFHIRKNNEIPHMLWLGLKDIHLYSIFKQVKKLGGYEAVTDKKLWKNLFGENNLPHLMITRRKYAKLLLPLEKSDVFTKNVSSIKSAYIESPSENKVVPIKCEKRVNFKVKIKDELAENYKLSNDVDLNSAEMAEIQSKLKSTMSFSNRKDVISSDDVKFVTTVNSTTNKISVPVTVIVGTTQDSKDLISSNSEKKSIVSSNTTNGKNVSKKFQIQQPHTTITVHQTTIHPHANSNKITNKIQITNQIQIQQITVQPTRSGLSSVEINNNPSDLRCNINKNQELQLIKIEDNHFNSHDLKQNVRGKEEKTLRKKNIPFIAPGTTITPVLSTLPPIQPVSLDSKKFPVNVDTENITATTTTISSSSVSKSLSINNSRTMMKSPIHDVFSPFKKRKLDILREGGLEVTAISNKHGVISSSVPLSIPKLNRSLERNSIFDISSMLDVSIPNQNGLNIKTPQIGTSSMYTRTDKIFGNPKDILHDSVAYICKKDNKLEEILDLTLNTSKEYPDFQISHNYTTQSTTPPPLNLSTALIAPKIPKLSENGLQITLVPASQQTGLFEPLTYTQNVHNSQNHNMKRKAVDTIDTGRSEMDFGEIKKSNSPNGTSSPNLSYFPPYIPNIAAVAAASQNDFLPMYLSNLYSQTPNLFLPNRIPQELLQFYKNLPADLGMIPVTKS